MVVLNWTEIIFRFISNGLNINAGPAHFNWMQLIPFVGSYDSIYLPLATASVAALLLILFSVMAYLALPKSKTDLKPAGALSIRGISESLVEFIISLKVKPSILCC